MKKFFIVLIAVVAFGFTSNAQNAIGVRGVFGNGSGAEVSYQTAMGSANRLELDLGWHNFEKWGSYINLTGVYQWNFNITGGLGWYAGIGANVGMFTGNKVENGNIGLGFDAQIGIEYNFDFPLQISLDFRPQWDVLGAASGFGYGLALGLRYRF